jgi:hypothetical protein
MADSPHWVLIRTHVDQATAEKLRRIAAESSPRQHKSELIRHLIRLGLAAHEAQEAA